MPSDTVIPAIPSWEVQAQSICAFRENAFLASFWMNRNMRIGLSMQMKAHSSCPRDQTAKDSVSQDG